MGIGMQTFLGGSQNLLLHLAPGLFMIMMIWPKSQLLTIIQSNDDDDDYVFVVGIFKAMKRT